MKVGKRPSNFNTSLRIINRRSIKRTATTGSWLAVGTVNMMTALLHQLGRAVLKLSRITSRQKDLSNTVSAGSSLES